MIYLAYFPLLIGFVQYVRKKLTLTDLLLMAIIITNLGNQWLPLNMATLVFFIAFIGLHLIIGRSFNRDITKLYLIVLIIYVFNIASFLISFVQSDNPGIGLSFIMSFFRTDGAYFLTFIPLLAIPLLDPKRVSTDKLFQLNLLTVACVTLITLFIDGTINRFGEYHGLYSAHNAAGSVLGFYATVGVTYLLYNRARNKLFILSTAMILIGLFITQSRGSFLAFFLTMALVVSPLIFKRVTWTKLFGILAGMLAVPFAIYGVLFHTNIGSRLMLLLNIRSGTAGMRFSLYDKAIERFASSPIFGTGFGTFNDLIDRWSGIAGLWMIPIRHTVITDEMGTGNNAHNSYFQFLAETGVVGLLLVLCFWFLVVFIFKRMIKRSASKEVQAIFTSGLASIVYLFLISMTEHYMGSGALMLNLSTFLGISLLLARRSKEQEGVPTGTKEFIS
jgi:O-antigen ligase